MITFRIIFLRLASKHTRFMRQAGNVTTTFFLFIHSPLNHTYTMCAHFLFLLLFISISPSDCYCFFVCRFVVDVCSSIIAVFAQFIVFPNRKCHFTQAKLKLSADNLLINCKLFCHLFSVEFSFIQRQGIYSQVAATTETDLI